MVLVLKENDLIQAFTVAREHVLSRPRGPTSVPLLVQDVVDIHLQRASVRSDYADYLSYVFRHLRLLCLCAVSTPPAFHPITRCLRDLIISFPEVPAWRAIRQAPMEAPEFSGNERLDAFTLCSLLQVVRTATTKSLTFS